MKVQNVTNLGRKNCLQPYQRERGNGNTTVHDQNQFNFDGIDLESRLWVCLIE